MTLMTCSFDYEKVKRIGKGNFGEVWLVNDRQLEVVS